LTVTQGKKYFGECVIVT